MVLKVTTVVSGLLVAGLAFGVGCGKGGPETLIDPAEALLAGQPRAALELLGVANKLEPDVGSMNAQNRAVFIAASLDLERWGDAERGLALVRDGIEHGLLSCYLFGKRGDIGAEAGCREAIAKAATKPPSFVSDSAHLGLTVAIDLNNRVEKAELVLRTLATERPFNRNRKALVDFHERVGWMKEAAETLEVWHVASPDDVSIRARLVAALDRKVRGDLLEKRGVDAEQSVRRLMALRPDNGSYRYFLADALAMNGKTEEADKERAAAKASGAPEPKSPTAVPGVD